MKILIIISVLVVFSYAKSKSKTTSRIVGGEDALVHEFPYQVSIQYRDPERGNTSHNCGGTILNSNYVLTAAHCKPWNDSYIEYLSVIAGAHDFSNKTGFEQTREIESIVMHNEYRGDVGPHDIAVLKVKTPFVFNEKVKAATLPKKNYKAIGLATLSGWGFISRGRSDTRPLVLQKGLMEIYDDAKCFKLWEGGRYHNSNLCAGSAPGKIAACKGDSGGPLSQKVGNETLVVGVTSWAYYPCGAKDKPTVFVEVAHYIDWIKEKLK